jgi:hypothetical protein
MHSYSPSFVLHVHYIFLELIILIIIIIIIMKLFISQFSVTSSLYGQDILLSTLFSNTLCLCSSLNVREEVSHPYRNTCKIIVLYILIFKFLDRRLELPHYNTMYLGKRRFGRTHRLYLQGLEEELKPVSTCHLHVTCFLLRFLLKIEELVCSSETSVCFRTTQKTLLLIHVFPPCDNLRRYMWWLLSSLNLSRKRSEGGKKCQ